MHALAGTSMAVIVIIMVVQVVARYVFNASLIWAEELCRYILVWMTFLFIGTAFQRGELITIDVFTLRLAPRPRFALKAAVSVPVLIFLALMVTNSYSYVGNFGNQMIPAVDFIWMSITGGRTADVSIQWVYHSVTVGSGLLFAHILFSLVAEGRELFFAATPSQPAGHGS
jgi:TRAP-type C4-dicarboxylate transport system permease small subunit